MYKVHIKPIALYVCEVWTLTKINEKKLTIFEMKLLRQIFVPKNSEEINEYKRRVNDGSNSLYNP